MSKGVTIPVPIGWYICYDPGRTIAYPQTFASKGLADAKILQLGLIGLHSVIVPEQRIGVYDYDSLLALLKETVLRLFPDFQGSFDGQNLVQYWEAMTLAARSVSNPPERT